jgi:hypothetical protein
MENEKEDKVVNVVVTDSQMAVILKDGTRCPVKAKTTETFYESGRKDCHIVLEKPLALLGEQKPIGK